MKLSYLRRVQLQTMSTFGSSIKTEMSLIICIFHDQGMVHLQDPPVIETKWHINPIFDKEVNKMEICLQQFTRFKDFYYSSKN